MSEEKRKDSFSKLINDDKPVLVDFSAEWCGPCKMIAPVLKELSGKMGEKLKIIKVDIDKNPAIADSYRVQSVPTLMLFQNGSVLWRQSGVVPLSFLEKTVREHIHQ